LFSIFSRISQNDDFLFIRLWSIWFVGMVTMKKNIIEWVMSYWSSFSVVGCYQLRGEHRNRFHIFHTGWITTVLRFESHHYKLLQSVIPFFRSEISFIDDDVKNIERAILLILALVYRKLRATRNVRVMFIELPTVVVIQWSIHIQEWRC